jgi:hypothetical protein
MLFMKKTLKDFIVEYKNGNEEVLNKLIGLRETKENGGDTYITVNSQKAVFDEKELSRTLQRLGVLYG